MAKVLSYVLMALAALLVILAVYLLVRIMGIYRKARRLEKMRNYETILYAALQKLGSRHTLDTLLPNADLGVLEDVLLRMGEEGAEGWREKIIELYSLCGFTDMRLADLRSRSGKKRAEAARRLGKICDPRAVPQLKELLEDPDEDVREAALFALNNMGSGLES